MNTFNPDVDTCKWCSDDFGSGGEHEWEDQETGAVSLICDHCYRGAKRLLAQEDYPPDEEDTRP